ncbi:MAG: RHS repeat-associated core domain-containing protein [Verrucomicrobiota bacterium]
MKLPAFLLSNHFGFIALSFLVSASLMSSARANDPWYVHCKKKCASCEGGSCGSQPTTKTHTTENTFDTDDPAKDEADANKDAKERNKNGEDCYASSQPLQDSSGKEDGEGEEGGEGGQAQGQGGGGGGGFSQFASRGVSSLTYDRGNILFDGLPMGAIKKELHPVTQKMVPSQVAGKKSVFVYTDLAPAGSGYQTAEYLKNQLPAPSANGIYTIPANVEPLAVTKYRNPDATPMGKMDVVYRQRHAQGSGIVTRTVRVESLPGANQWNRKFYLGDPVEDSSLQPYREVSVTRTENPDGSETDHEVTRERFGNGAGDWVVVSDETKVMGFYKLGEPVVLSETKHTGTGSDLTTTWTYYTDNNKQESFNKPATMRRSDGKWADYTYTGSVVTGVLVNKTVSGWLDNPAPAVGTAADENSNRVVVEIEALRETGTFGREEKIQGVLVSKTWGERYKANPGELIEKSRVETGTATLTTIRTGYPDTEAAASADRGRLKSIQNPNGTMELYSYALQGENLIETVDKGAGTLAGVTTGIRTVSTFTKHDVLIKEVISDISSGVELSAKEAIAFDVNGSVSRWAHNNNPDDYSETLQGCCGIDSERSRDGSVTTYTRDANKRPTSETSLGITTTHTYGKKTISGNDFPTHRVVKSAGGLTRDMGTEVMDHAGNMIERISPDLNGDGNGEVTSIIRNFSTRTITTTNPDGGTAIESDYADGQSKSQNGTAVAPAAWAHATHSEQGGGMVTTSYAGDSSSSRWTKSYANLHGETFKITAPGSSGEIAMQTNVCDQLCRVIKTTDADGVTTLFAYNTEGERYRSAIDLNQNGEIDANDRVTDAIREVVAESPVGPALRTQHVIYDLANNPVITSTTYQSVNGLSSRTEILGSSGASVSTTDPHTARTDGAWTQTTTSPNGTKQIVTYSNWLPAIAALHESGTDVPPVIQSSSTTYDALRRPIIQTDSRTGSVTSTFAASGQVASIDDHGRVTSFTYDAMGRRTSTTLPDNSVTHTSYWPTDNEKATWGSQTNPVVKLYSPQGELVELRTFRSSNLALAPDETTAAYDVTTWTFDNRGQLIQKTYADGKGPSYTYTPGGKLLTRTWARTVGGNPLVTTYGYNSAGELTTTDYSDSTPDVTVAFDKLGRQTFVSNGYATSTFTYDPATLRIDAETISYDLDKNGTAELTRVLDRSQDVLGRDAGYSLHGSAGVPPAVEAQASYQYSATSGRVESVGNGTHNFAYGYLSNSNLLASVTGPTHTVTNTYAADRNVLLFKENKAGATTVSKYEYSVNAIGQRTAVAQTGSVFPAATGWNWDYDVLGQVTTAEHANTPANHRAYQYDAIGNRNKAASGVLDPADPSATAYTANNLNQYTAVGTVSPIHDADGNMTSGPIPAGSAGLVWDAENRLITASISGGDTAHYVYDSQSRRIARTVETDTTVYLYDAWNCIAEYQGSAGVPPAISKSYLWGTDLSGSLQSAGGVGGLLLITDHSALITSRSPTYDGNGNVSEYLDSTGAIAAHFEHDPFGSTVVNTDTGNLFVYRFSTKPGDAVTGLYYYGYRWYDRATGKWPSRDPLGEEGFFQCYMQAYLKDLGEEQNDLESSKHRSETYGNLYALVKNNPINFFDVLGLLSREEAEKLLKEYNVVDYKTKTSSEVFAFIGGWLKEKHDSGDLEYANSCAIRLSVAWSRFGKDLNGQSGANFIGSDGNSANLGGKKHVIISAHKMAGYLKNVLGAPDYQTEEEYRKNGKPGDILIWGDALHVGMAPCDDIGVGSFISGPIWVFKKG